MEKNVAPLPEEPKENQIIEQQDNADGDEA